VNEARQRFQVIHQKVAPVLPDDKRTARLSVADLGCGTGAQCEVWAELGHAVHGLDIDAAAIATARQAADSRGHEIDYRIGSASEAPWPTGSMDLCLLVELLEHVPRWEACLDECARMLRAGGILFLSTTNRLCPRQQEFELPLYSWYPQTLKRRFERLAVTSRPDLVHGSRYPAVNWFTPRQLCDALEQRGFVAADRIDMFEVAGRDTFTRGLTRLIRAARPLRFAAHVVTPYTAVLGVKKA
jgi:2-polyprenyl-6-hydroxyphenyl methylase/3-demethylubiquinone-9 3-methyltransferase